MHFVRAEFDAAVTLYVENLLCAIIWVAITALSLMLLTVTMVISKIKAPCTVQKEFSIKNNQFCQVKLSSKNSTAARLFWKKKLVLAHT